MMKKRNCFGSVCMICACCAVLLMLGNTTSAENVLLNDTYDIPDPPATTATRGDEVADPLDTAWYTIGPGATPGELSIVPDVVINTGDAFEIAGNAPNSRVWGGFPSVTLTDVGHYLELSFDINVTSADNSTTGFRFGLYDSATDPAALPIADKTDDAYYLGAADGYVMMLPTGDPGPFALVRREQDDRSILSASGADQGNYNAPLNTTDEESQLTVNTKHTVNMKLTKTDTGVMNAGMRTVLTVDGFELLNYIDDGTYTLPDPADPYGYLDTFDGVVLGSRGGSTTGAKIFRVDNVRVATNVPEPSALVLLAVGGLMFVIRRRGH